MNKSSIEWTDVTWNPVTGCTKVSAGCKNCYAESTFKRFEKKWHKFGDLTCHEDRLQQPYKIKKPSKIFVNSMSDLFHKDVPFDFIDKVMKVIKDNPQHTFQVLTKRPKVAFKYYMNSENLPPSNMMLGFSISTQKDMDNLMELKERPHYPECGLFLSIEPLLEEVELPLHIHYGGDKVFDWVIVGGESGRNARPMHPDWVKSIRDQCKKHGVPFFFKQWGEWMPGDKVPLDYIKGKDQFQEGKYHDFGDNYMALKVGKKNAGAMLDCREWKEFPR